MPSSITENVAKGGQDRPVEDIIIADSGEVNLFYANQDVSLTFDNLSDQS
jgi:hypothetical protein